MGKRLTKRRSGNGNIGPSMSGDQCKETETVEMEERSNESFRPPFIPPFAAEEGITELSRNGSFSTLGLPKSGFPSMNHLGSSELDLLKIQPPSRSESTLTDTRIPKGDDAEDEDSDDGDSEDSESRLVKKSWFRRLNPFHKGPPPPIPKDDAGLVPEMTASWFSKLTWGWISPLMMVCFP